MTCLFHRNGKRLFWKWPQNHLSYPNLTIRSQKVENGSPHTLLAENSLLKAVSRHTVLYPEAHFVQWGSSLKRMQDLLMRTYKLLR